MIHWLPDQRVQHSAAAAVGAWTGAAPAPAATTNCLLDAVIAATNDLSGQADVARSYAGRALPDTLGR
ncbi:hypothetical protein [Streptomyces sp. NPDC002769]|uniref:hypothetical protein n=1 Tax=Streptomyces sp. NPDC002769 TaxID=3154542 RepID=UPI003322C51F